MKINVLKDHVLVEQKLKKKINSKILLPDGSSQSQEDNVYEQTSKIVGFSPLQEDVEFKKYDVPIFNKYADPIFTKITKGEFGDLNITRLAIYRIDDIIGTTKEKE